MGHARSLCYAATLILTGCEDKFTKSGTAEEVARLNMRVIDLELAVNQLKEQSEKHNRQIASVDSGLDKLWDQVSHNAKIANENAEMDNKRALRDATARGLCGQETIQYPSGGWTLRNRECTWKLLGK